ncbi:hypothetical protein B2J96_20445 [Mycobacterium shigaense]|nr:hypothetical protein B2J96_20445 [Mycobacterium shigaense]
MRRSATHSRDRTPVPTWAATLSAGCGAGSQPCSTKPNSPTVRDSAKAPSVPRDNAPASHTNQSGPPSPMSTAIAQNTLACARKPNPTTGMLR